MVTGTATEYYDVTQIGSVTQVTVTASGEVIDRSLAFDVFNSEDDLARTLDALRCLR